MENAGSTGAPDAKRIHVLPQEVVNRIAAGEVLVRPVNAIKEMLENSLDAKSTSIRIAIKDGGLKLIQISDNGSGIKVEDMDIVCERFTTSKLAKFEDLTQIQTYGFRGEALASISHVAHVSIVSMTKDQACAYRANYSDSKLMSKDGGPPEPKPCAGTQGTTITVEDLFYNVPARRKAFKNPSDEYSRIFDMVMRYALHNSGVSFNLKKHGDTKSDVHTTASTTLKDNIRLLYGSKVASEIIEIQTAVERHSVQVRGYITGPNYVEARKMTFILFINNRLVDCQPLKKNIELIYTQLFAKTLHPWVYISITFPPHIVDVNVHPTKSEVRFMHQEEIITEITAKISEELERMNVSRTFDLAELTCKEGSETGLTPITAVFEGKKAPETISTAGAMVGESPSKAKYQHQMVRSDSKMQRLDGFLSPVRASTPGPQMDIDTGDTSARVLFDTPALDEFESPAKKPKTSDDPAQTFEGADEQGELNDVDSFILPRHTLQTQVVTSEPVQPNPEYRARRRPNKPRAKPQFAAIILLLEGAEAKVHPGLRKIFSNYVFCGCVDSVMALIQFETKLFVTNTSNLTQVFVYQEVLHRFAELEPVRLSEPLPLKELALMALEDTSCGFSADTNDAEKVSANVVSILCRHAEMLAEYVAIEIDSSGRLVALPAVFDDYQADISYLPQFIMRLAMNVEWRYEQPCFDTLAQEIARFYSLKKLEDSEGLVERKWTIEHVIFPAIRQRFAPPQAMAQDGTIVQVASLEKLYKVFERC